MKNIWHIGFNDVKLMVRDKIFFFWTLAFPMLFILIFGNLFQGSSTTTAASLKVINYDQGQWGNFFIEKLKSPGIDLEILQEEPEIYNRILVIPKDFSENLQQKKSQSLMFKRNSKANVNAAAQAETKIIQAIAKTITELILQGDTDNNSILKNATEFKNIIDIHSIFPENTLKKVPRGFDHTIPGILVQFIMMMVLIYGGVTVMEDRKKGLLTRILYSSVTITGLWGGKFLGRFMMGIIQAFILILTGILFFHLNLGNVFLSLLNVTIFSLAIASLSIFLGSVIEKEDLIVGLSVLAANIFAALGGCWWPIEIVPQTFKTIAVISPAYWAMDGFHKIIFFNKGLSDIAVNFGVLFGFILLFTFLAIKYFKIKD